MPGWIKKTLKYSSFVLLAVVIILAGLIIHAQINEFSPQPTRLLKNPAEAPQIHYDREIFTFVSWNIGYGGLGKDMDFFYDGGERVRPKMEEFKQYSKGIYKNLSLFSNFDFILLQEVDIDSRRSYYNNEKKHISEILPSHESFFATNYNVRFVPMPVTKPLGKVESGIQLLSKLPAHISSRHYYESSYSWPYRLFMLDRVFIKNVYHLKKGKNLVIYNTHNSAFDSEGKLRKQEFATIKNDMLNEFIRGNYVVAGGDWNQNPPGFDPSDDPHNYNLSIVEPKLETNSLPKDWQWVWSPGTPTNRSNDRPFEKGKNNTTIIDYFIISPNLSLDTVFTRDLQFRFSDHQPVFMRVSIPQPEEDTTTTS